MNVRSSFATLLAGLLVTVVATACSVGDDDDGDSETCNCPLTGPANIEVLAPCDTHPAVSASGACDTAGPLTGVGTANVYGTAAGTCHVEVVHDDGTTSSADFAVAGTWLACGSAPHGCGEQLTAPTLSGNPLYEITLGSVTCDAGAPAPDGSDASEAADGG